MTTLFSIDGEFFSPEDAKVSALDRGFLFGDGVYEVLAVIGGKLIEFERHYSRLARSMDEVGIASPFTRESFLAHCRALIAKANLDEGSIYIQITRGADMKRDFAFPVGVSPTVVLYTSAKSWLNNPLAISGVPLVAVRDQRWARRDIKSVSLLAQVLAKQEAQSKGGFEAMMHDDAGFVTEGASSSILIVNEAGHIVVKPLNNDILPGCTRAAVLALAAEEKLEIVERNFTIDECLKAREVILTSALHFVLPAIRVNGQAIGSGQPGPVSKSLRRIYIEYALATAL